jgi:hypothetical protein
MRVDGFDHVFGDDLVELRVFFVDFFQAMMDNRA